jgi:hypothetical protein
MEREEFLSKAGHRRISRMHGQLVWQHVAKATMQRHQIILAQY